MSDGRLTCKRCGKEYALHAADPDVDKGDYCFECRQDRRQHGRVEQGQADCENCFGTGNVMGADCPMCEGKGYVEKTQDVLPELGEDGRWIL